jgi:SpoVK/Ycf46/Vps4 family AAA+-type ATPase
MITLAEILLLHLRDEQLGEDVDLHDIASKTNYYSGSDLKGEFLYSQRQQSHQSIYFVLALCVSAAMASVKDSVGNFSWTSHTPFKANDVGDTPHQASDEAQFPTRTITLNNFTHAMNEVPSSAGDLSELLRWHNNCSGANPQINGLPETRTYSGNGGRRYNWK